MSLQDKVVLITGGGSGIGANTARALVSPGAKVILNGRRKDVLKNTAEDIDPIGKNIVWIAGDIGQAETRERIVDTAIARYGAIDILFNNAGIFEPKAFLDHIESDLESYLNLLRGYFFLTQKAIAQMQKQAGGAVINIGLMWSLQAVAVTPCSASSAVKGAVHALTRNLAIEFAPDKIRVNAIAPAVVETPLFDSLLTPEQLTSFNSFHPLGRNGKVQDITEAVLFLADSDRSGWITGVVLPVDGGVTAGRN
ncbi:MAG: SDR family oxidoreductase [Cyanobacteria bacterium J06631_6]